MKDIALYSLRVNALLCLFYLFYRIILQNDRAFVFNRLYLLSSAVLSFCIPLLQLPSIVSSVLVEINLSEVTIYELHNRAIRSSQLTYGTIISAIYLIGAIIAFFVFIKNLLQILLVIIRGHKTKKTGYIMVETKNSGNIYSFLKYLIVPSPEQKEEIIAHETTHIQQLHTLDVLFFELISIVFWFNPVCHFYKYAIREIHEFIADRSAVKENNNNEYAQLIVSHALNIDHLILSGGFMNHSFLKRRIKMLTQNTFNNSRKIKVKYLTLLPLLLSTILLTSFIKENNLKISNTENAIYSTADQMPEFQGGSLEMMRFLANNIRYPREAKEKNIEGTVYINFIVDQNGEVKNVKILKGVDQLLDNEAIRVIENMPKWIPGQNKGEAVSVYFNLPVKYVLK